jgi:hypothetical protein
MAVREDIFMGKGKHLKPIEMKDRNRLKFEPALVLVVTKISPRIEELACQKQAQPSH